MNKGTDFERKSKDFLESLFTQLGFAVVRSRQQETGTQGGFDILISFHDDQNKELNFFVECKDYSSREVAWKEMLDKIMQLNASRYQIDGFIGLSPRQEISNLNSNVLASLPQQVKFPIRFWTPESQVKEYFLLDENFYQYVYGESIRIPENEKKLIKRKLRNVVANMLDEKEKLIIEERKKTFIAKELTLKFPRINPNDIVGRSAELKELHDLLFDNKKVVVVNGLGGIGKTTLVQAYLTFFYGKYKHIAWISQTSSDIVSDMVSDEGLLSSLGISKEGRDIKEIGAEMLYRLKSVSEGPNLLILDNTDATLSKLKDKLPGLPHWHLLTTSREHIEHFYSKELGFLSPVDAVALFKKYCNRIKDDNQIEELVKIVDYHTLTIEILAKAARMPGKNIDMLKKAIEDDLQVNVGIRHSQNKIDRVRSYLSSIFNMSGLKEHEIWIIKQFTCLPSEFHSYNLLSELLNTTGIDEWEVYTVALNELVSKGWLLYNEVTETYKMHLIVKEVAIVQLPFTLRDVEQLLEIVTQKLEIDQIKDNPLDKFSWIPFGKALLERFSNDELSIEVAELQNNLGMIFWEAGDYIGAKPLLERALLSAEKHFGPDHHEVLVYCSNLGVVLRELGDYAKARNLLNRVLTLTEKHFGIDHPNVSMSCSILGLVLQDIGDYTEARKLLERALVLDEQHFGQDHPKLSVRYSNLGVLLQKLGDLETARKLLERALMLTEQHFGPDHPNVSVSCSNLGSVLQNLGEFERSRTLLERALMLSEQHFGKNHPDVSVCCSNLGLVLQDLGDFEGARKLLERVLTLTEQQLGPDHPRISVSCSNLGLLLQDLGDNEGARRFLERALILAERHFGEKHPHVSVLSSNLGTVLHSLGDYTESKKLYERSLILDEELFGPDHLQISVICSNLGEVLWKLKDYTGARRLMERALAIYEKQLGLDHPDAILLCSKLASILYNVGDHTGAHSLLERVPVFQNKETDL